MVVFKLNKYENIEIISFDYISDVYNTIGIELMQLENENDYIAVYGKVDLIKDLFTTMICDGYEFGYADFDTLDEMQKDMIYMMFIRRNCVISVEPAYSKNDSVMGHDAKVNLFYMDDCKQDAIDYCVNHDMKVILFDFENEDYKNDEEESETEHTYTVNRKTVDKNTFDEYVSKFAPDLVNNEEKDKTSDDEGYSISVKCNLDADEALEIIADMERRMMHMNDMFREMDNFRRLFNW